MLIKLIQQVVAVVGHELGHWALSHTVRQLGVAELNILLTLFCFSHFYTNEVRFAGLWNWKRNKPNRLGLEPMITMNALGRGGGSIFLREL